VFGADFQQIPPVIPRGGCQDIVAASMQHSVSLERLISPTKNMHLNADATPGNAIFAEWLADMSHDPNKIGRIPIPPMIWRSVDFNRFVDRIYPQSGWQESLTNPSFFNGRTILAN
jgi:PIF1-like helicase